jgi:DNA-binding beta-propeller fold protein YncE
MKAIPIMVIALLGVGAAVAARMNASLRLGKQDDGGFVVSSGQRVEAGTIAFDGRANDLALHPTGKFFAVVANRRVFLARPEGVIAESDATLPAAASFHGIAWTPDGAHLLVSMSNGVIQELALRDEKLTLERKLTPKPDGAKGNANPGGMAITRDGKTLYVADCDRNSVAELDLTIGAFVREFPTQNLPFEVRLTADERTLIASDWGGVRPTRAKADGDDDGDGKSGVQSGDKIVVANQNGSAATGTVELIDRVGGTTRRVAVGLHPTGMAVSGTRPIAYVANAASDTISVIDTDTGKATHWGRMPCALALTADEKTLYVCDGGDNAIAVVDLTHDRVLGMRPAGFFPTDLALASDGKTAYVVNSKGNGSVRRTVTGKPGNAHDFQGSVSVIDLTANLDSATRQVAANNGWERGGDLLHPDLAVYHGAIQHVIYIIKENRSYDEVFGDLKQGNGDPTLCDLGDHITPNAHQLVQNFTLFDNGYVSGTNSADGHCWCDQAAANDYLEHLYTDYRTYPDGEDDAMAINAGGCLWDAVLKKHKTVRVYGEASDYDASTVEPKPASWLDVFHDRAMATYKMHVVTRLPSLKPLKNPNYLYWPLLQSDQSRADVFLKEYNENDTVPDLMVLSLPCDHTEGSNARYPKPQSMVADNDLALGRIVEGVSHSPQWKSTCILVIEDDAQAGLDHVDGHRTVFMAYSPYIRRHYVDSNFYTTVSLLHSIELMLGLDPMNRFDATAPPLAACFTDKPDLTPYTAVPNNIPLDDMNVPKTALNGAARDWANRSDALDWSGMDRADAATLSEILWYSVRGYNTPYPAGYAPEPAPAREGASGIRKPPHSDD